MLLKNIKIKNDRNNDHAFRLLQFYISADYFPSLKDNSNGYVEHSCLYLTDKSEYNKKYIQMRFVFQTCYEDKRLS